MVDVLITSFNVYSMYFNVNRGIPTTVQCLFIEIQCYLLNFNVTSITKVSYQYPDFTRSLNSRKGTLKRVKSLVTFRIS